MIFQIYYRVTGEDSNPFGLGKFLLLTVLAYKVNISRTNSMKKKLFVT